MGMPETKIAQAPPSQLKIWWLAARPKTLWASVAPVLMGSALALGDGVFHGITALVTLLAAMAIQIGTNLANDYFDYIKGADTEDRLGPTRATQAGWVTPAAMKRAFILAFAIAFFFGLYLIYRGGWPILAIGLASILFGILYTAGPAPLGYTGWADLFVLIFFGPVAVGGTYYVQALEWRLPALIAGLGPGFLSVALLTINNLRDVETDARSGKKTLAVRFGKQFARMEFFLSFLIAAVIPVVLLLWYPHKVSVVGVSAFVLFRVFPLKRRVWTYANPVELNQVLEQTGKTIFVYSILFFLVWVTLPV